MPTICMGGYNQLNANKWILMQDPGITIGKIIRRFKAKTTRLNNKYGEIYFKGNGVIMSVSSAMNMN